MSSNNFPPSRYLPHWSRVGQLGKPCFTRRLAVNQPQQQLPVVPVTDWETGTTEAEVACHYDVEHSSVDHRVASLQRNIQFLQQQHRETLEKLHAEIDYLKRENKELQYKLIMKASDSSSEGLTKDRWAYKAGNQNRKARPSLHLEPLQDTLLLRDQGFGFAEGGKVLDRARLDHGADMKGHLITSLHPLQIQRNPSHAPRGPTLQECEVIIHQLSSANRSQSQEILHMKTLLGDIILSKKIPLQNDILVKPYLLNGNGSGPSHSGVVLPALKQSTSSTITDRQRSIRTVQRPSEKDSAVTVSNLRQRGACNSLRNHLHK